ncbi:Vomp family autotransporter [Bartonella sp. B1098]|uniref:Vomp family autotransporter n=1 Tax=Bartonella sp. B1098 TaxID=2911421 RepID=UPI00273A6074|nr:Vomp family autotransporter [Bartonella sp. B1098]
MKELSIISKKNDWDYGHFSQHLFKKLLLGTAVVAFLSNTSPVYAKNFDIIKQILQVLEKATAVYSQANNQNTFSTYNPYIGFFIDASLSKASYLTALNSVFAAKVSTSSGYADFLTTTLSEQGKIAVNVLKKDGSYIRQATQKTSNAFVQTNPDSSVGDDYGNRTTFLNTPTPSEENSPIQVNGRSVANARAGSNATNLGQRSNAAGQESVAIGYKAQATGKFAITIGNQAQATKEDSIAIGHMAHALGKSSVAVGSEYNERNPEDYTIAKGDYSMALGSISQAIEYGSTAIGHRAYATERNTVSIGFYSRAKADHAIALGADSIANVAAGVEGYNPLLHKAETDGTFAWKSTYGAVSVGDLAKSKTRQIEGVAAGTEDTDAVNIAQLKSLQTYVDKGWKLSVDGKNTKVVGINETVDFATGSKNLEITKGKDDNKVKFDLAKELTLDSVKLGTNTLDSMGLKITNGPQITIAGISAGNKKITGVAQGTEDTDAVNVAQLKALSLGSGSKDHFSDWSTDRVRIGVDKTYSTQGSVVIGKKYMSQGTHGEVFESAIVRADLGIAIGTRSLVEKKADRGIAIGERAKVEISGGIALGRNSTANVKEGFFGYDPKTGKNSTSSSVEWKSKDGAFSIGKVGNGGGRWTRQIVGVAAGTQETDAVNVAQLKALRELITKQGSWELSVGDKNTVIDNGDKLIFAAGSPNFSIISNKEEKKVTFDLAKDLRLNSIKLGGEALANAASSVTLDATGLIITNGPKIVTDGIDVGNKKITGLAEGFEATDAVNFSQLQKIEKEVEQQVVASSFVKQEAETQHITIGKDTDGDKIDIANNKSEKRALTGIKNGALTEDSSEAVTGSQLFTTNNNVTTLKNNFSEIQTRVTEIQTNLSTIANNTSQYLGGGADVLNSKEPIYTVEGKSYNDVASAFSGVSHSFTEVKQQITNVNNSITNVENQIKNVVSDSLVKQDSNTKHIAIGKDTDGDKIDIANSKSENRILTGIKDGALSEESKEAITGSQLFTTNQKVGAVSINLQTAASNIAKYFGGNAKYEDGKWTDPKFTVKTVKADGNPEETSYTNVAEALAGVGTSLTHVQNNVSEQVNNMIQKMEGESLVQQDKATQHITIGRDTDGDKIDIANKNKEKRTLTGIKAAVLLETSNEAVIGSQLFETNDKVSTYLGGGASYKDGKWSAPTFKVQTVDNHGNKKDEAYTDVASAFEGVGTSITNVQNKVTNDITNKFSELNQNITNITQQVQGDALLWSDEAQAFSAHHKKKAEEQGKTTGAQENSKITFLLDGAVSKDSTDAITGKQLYYTSNTLATYLNKSAGYDEQGNWKAPSFKVKTVKADGDKEDKTYQNVAEAFEGVGTSITNVQNKITNEITNQITHLQSDDSAVVHYDKQKGSTTNYASVTFGGKDHTLTVLHNVADGMISTESHDAINGKQINKIGEDIAKSLGGNAAFNNGAFTGPTYKLSYISKDGVVTERSLDGVGVAIAGLDTNIQNVNQRIKEVSQGVAQDSLSWSKDANAFSAQHGGEEKTNSKIKFLANGDISTASTDAINGSQLFETNNKVATYLGGGAEYKDGKWQAPSFMLKSFSEEGKESENKTYNNVGSAFVGIDTNFTNVNNHLTNIVEDFNKKIDHINKEVRGDALLWSNSESAFVAQHDTKEEEKKNSKITHLLDGAISKDSTDAVTGGQLYSLKSTFATYFGGGAGYDGEGKWQAPSFKVKTVKADGDKEDKTYQNVAEAFEGVGTSITNVQNKITNEITNQITHLQSDDSAVVHYDKQKGSTTNYASVTFGGKDHTLTVLHNVADGMISTESHDAINGKQINKIGEDIAKSLGGNAAFNNGAFTEPTYKLSYISKDGVVTERSLDGVGVAIAGLDISIQNVNQRIKEVSQGVAQDSLSWSKDAKAFSAQHGGEEKTNSKIKFLANGDISAASTDAINGSQLFETNNKVATYLGGGAEYKDGNWTAPSFTLQTFSEDGKKDENKTYNDVGSAFAGIDANFTNVNNHLTNIVEDFNKKVDNINKEVKGDALLWSNTDNAFVAQHGEKEKTDSKITHLLDGTISKDSTDAVTGGQLYSLKNTFATYFGGGAGYDEKGEWQAPSFKVKTVKADGAEEEQTYQNVADAFEGVGSSFTNIKNEITNQINNEISNVKGDSLVKKDTTTNLITIGKEVIGNEINIANKNSEDRTLSGVKEAVNNNEAVNKGQLDTNIKKVEDKLTEAVGNVTQQVQSDALLWSESESAFSAQHGKDKEKKNSKIMHLLDGTISKDSTDAVTGGQLYSLKSTFATYFGGGAGYDEKGEWQAPSFKVKTVKADGDKEDKTYQNVAEAFEGVGTSIMNVQNTITNEITNQITHLQSEDSAVVHYDKQKDDTINYASVTFGGKDQTPTTLHNVADGIISDKSHDAITGGQIYKIGEDIAKFLGGKAAINNGAFIGPTYQLSEVSEAGQVTDKSFNDVGSAFSGLDTNIKNVNDRIKEVSEGVAQDSLNWSNSEGAFVAQHGGEEKTNSKIKFLANGDISAASSDAVAGNQLHALGSNVAKTLGGNASYKNGVWVAPSFKVRIVKEDDGGVKEESYDDVVSAFAGVGTSFENLQKEVTQSNTQITENIKQNALLWSEADKAFSAQHGGKEGAKANSKITHLLDGNIVSGSTDAITGNQLHSLGDKVATYFGGNAKYENGAWTDPTFKMKSVNADGAEEEQTYQNVVDAFEGVGSSFINIKNEITNQINNEISNVKGDSLVKKDTTTNLIAIGKEVIGNEINIANKNSEDRTLSGVKEAVNNNEAVNKAQLDTNIKKVEDQLTNAVNEFTQNITNVTQQVQGDALLWSNTDNAFVAQHGEKEKTDGKITHLLDGTISKDSTDAVTGGQLYSLKSTFATYFGGGAGYDTEGNWKTPSFKVKTVNSDGAEEEQTYQNVAEAFEGVGTSITNVQNKITNEITNQITHLQSEDSAVVHYDKQKDDTINYASVTFGGKDQTPTTLRNVADGSISDKSHEAITGGQIYKIGDDIAKFLGGKAAINNGAFTGPTYQLSEVSEAGQVTDKSFNDVGSAFAGLDTNIKNVNNRIKEVSEGVAQDSLNWSNSEDAFVAQHGGKEKTNSKIKFLANGDISTASTDAINGSQLFETNNKISTYLGGGANYKDGAWIDPTFKMKMINSDGAEEDQTYQNVAAAFEGVGSSFTNIKKEITNQITRLQSDDSAVVHYDKKEQGEIDYTNVNLGKGKGSTAVGLHNVADGAISSESRDAINGKQVNTIGEDIAKFLGGEASFKDGSLTQPTYNLSQVDANGKVTDKSFTDVGSAFSGLDTNIQNVNQRIKEVSQGVAQDSLSWSKEDNAFSAQHGEGKERTASKIKFLSSGAITKDSTEAVNGSQLFATNENVTAVRNDLNTVANNTSQYLGGNADVLSGNIPTFSVQNKEYRSVGEAFSGVDSSFTKLHDEINKNNTEITQHIEKDALLWNDESQAFVARHEKSKVEQEKATPENSKITFLLDGDVSKGSTEAVTGGQLYSMNEQLATYLGGGAGYDGEGNWTAPSFKVKTVNADGDKEDKNYTNVAEALTGVGSSITNVQNKITNEITNQINHLQSDDSAVVHYDKQKDGATNYASVTFGGKDQTLTVLHNVGNGTISDKSHEAITGGQIYKIGEDIARFLGGNAAFNNGAFTEPTYNLSQVDEKGEALEAKFKDVGSAFAGLDKNIKNVNQRIKEVSQGVAQDSLSWSKEDNAFSAQHGEGKERTSSKITHILDGNIASGSTDAVTGGQLYSMSNTLATYFGGGAEYKEGKWAAPNFKVNAVSSDGSKVEEKSYNTVAEAFAGVGSSFTNIHNELKNEINQVVRDSLVKQDEESKVIKIGAEKGGTSITIANSDGTDRTLSGVKAAENDNEAVNKAQLDHSLEVLSNSLQSEDSAVVLYDKKENGETDYTRVTFGKGKGSAAVALHNVADGKISEDSHDAVNGGQINKVGKDIAKFLGGETVFKEGVFTGPSYKLSEVDEKGEALEAEFKDVGSAFAGLDKNIKNVNTHLTNVVQDFTQQITDITQEVKGDALLWSDTDHAFVATHGADSERKNSKITSLANGDITVNSTDAVTGGQLYSMNNTLATYFGGGAKYENGQWTAPSFKVNTVNEDGSKVEEQSYDNVAKAFASVGTSFSNLHNEVTNAVTDINHQINQVVRDSLVKQDEESKVIKIGAEKGGTSVTIANSDGADRTLSGLKAGDLSAGSTEAVNGGQLYSMNNTLASYFGGGAKYENGQWTAPSFKVNTVNEDGSKVEEQSYDNIAKAFASVGTSFSNLHNEVTNAVTDINHQINQVVRDSLVKQDEESKVIKIGAEKGGTSITIANSDGADRTLSGLKAGDLSAGSTEAVNGGQLYSMNNTLASYFGGGAKYENGQWTAPNFKVNIVSSDGSKVEEQSYDNVAKAFASVGTSFSNLHSKVTNAVTDINHQISQVVKDSLVKQDEESKVIKIGAEKGGTSITIANSGDAARTLTGVKAGALTETSADAVNGSQLYSMSNTLATYFGGGAEYKEGKWATPNFKVNTVSADGSEVEEKSYNTVAEAFAGVGSSFTNIHKELKNEINQVVRDSLVKQDEKTHVIAVGGEKSGTEVTFANTDGATRTLTGVKAGGLSETSTEAVNGSQLFATNQNVTTVTGDLETVAENSSKYFGGGADMLNGIAPTYTVQDKSYQSVSDAFGGVDRSFTQLHEEISKNTSDLSEHIKQNALLWSDTDHAFVATHGADTERKNSKITSLANGDITANSTDAVTGGQLYSMNNTLASYFGGGAKYENGQWTAPNFKVNIVSSDGSKVEEQSYDNVAKAFASVGTSFSNLHSKVTNAVTDINHQISQVVKDSLVKQDEESKVIKIGAEKGGTSITIANSGDAARTLTGVKAGALTETSADAVNGSQLYSMSNTLATYFGGGAEYKEGKWATPNFKVNTVSADGSEVEEKSYNTVAEAFAGVGSSFTNIHKELKNEINQVVRDSLVKQDEKTHVIAVGGEKSGTEVTFANTDGATRTLTGVKAGGLSETSTEAVNGSQLFATNQNVTTVTGDLETVAENSSKYFGGGADMLNGIAPTYTVQDKSYQSVSDAFGGVDRSFTQLHEEISKNTSDLSEHIKQNALLWSDTDHAFVATHGADTERKNSKITSLANGDITVNSTDAVTGGQLYSMNNTLATYFGGGAKYENGQWTAPSFKVNTVNEDGSKVEEQSYDNVAKAFASVGTSFSNLHNEVTNAVTDINHQINQVVRDSLVKQDEESKVIKIGAEKGGTSVTIANSDGADRTLSGLKAGDLSAGSTEAVNGGQLYSMNNTLASYFGGEASYEDGEWRAPSFKIVSFKEDGSSEETIYDNVAAAFAGVNQSFTKLHHELSDNIEQNALFWSDADESFVALHGQGSEKHNSKLSHLVDGDISAGSTEAITGNQLYQLNQTLARYLGGGASYQGGQWTGPEFQITQFKSDGSFSEGKIYDNVAGAFEGVNGSLSGINDRLNNVAQNVISNSLNWNDELGGYDGRHDGADSKITHVADGEISEGSKEVVNGGQLWETNQKVSAVEQRVESIDQHVQAVENAVTNGAVNYDKDEDGHKTNKVTLIGGNESDPVLIDNLAEGRIESGSKEAVTGGQLHDYTDQQMNIVLEDAKKYTDEHVNEIVNNGVNESKAYTDVKFQTLNYAIEDVRKEARQAAAIGLATSNLRYYDIPGSLSISLGSGLWRSQSAFAIGAGYTSEDGNIRSNVSITSAGDHWGIGAGITLRLR